jgi:beta-glucanase (GH16 family)
MLRSTMYRALCATTLALMTACASSAAPEDGVRETESVVAPGVFYVLEAKHSGKALDVSAGSTADGANVQQWTKNGSAAQQWRFEAVPGGAGGAGGAGGYYVIRAKCSDKALDVANGSTAEGANVQQWGYGGGPNQQWSLEDAGGGYYYVRARNSGMLLDVAWGSTADGANVAQVRQYAGSDAQKWKLTAVTSAGGAPLVAGEYTIRSAQTGKCIDVPGSSTADGAKLQQWTCNGTHAQRFRAIDLGGGAFEILNVGSDKAFDVSDVSTAAGARLQQWGYGGGDNQRFVVASLGDDTYQIKAVHSGLVLDVSGASANDGTPIVQWPWNAQANQRFRFTPVSPTAGGTPTTSPTPAPAGGWKLAWSDEFDGAGLPDANKWGYDVGGGGWGNDEAEYYTQSRAENARLENGHLVIEARKESYGGRGYTSARLFSRNGGDWLYGRVEVRARLPGGRGTWPAIWMLPTDWKYGGWPNSGELDIMEMVGFDPGQIHGTTHTQAYNWTLGTQKTAQTYVADASSAYHTYATEWTADRIDVFVDGNKYFTFDNEHAGAAKWPFDQRFHLILNLAVGGSWGAVKGIDDAAFPQRMEVDYVRVYQR